MADKCYRENKNLLKETKCQFTLKKDAKRSWAQKLEEIKKNSNTVRCSSGLQRGACNTLNFNLINELWAVG